MQISMIKKSQILFLGSFAGAIALGALLLKIPGLFIGDGGVLRWSDALFTATSAVCVTGLSTVPVSDFSLPGQLVILLLIQIGGLGIMTMSASIIVLLGKNMSWSNTVMMSNLTEDFSRRGVENMLKSVFVFTLVVELAGAVALTIGFLLEEQGYQWYECVYYGIFHAISSFCNAGLSPFDSSMSGVSVFIKLTVAFMIILGGLGVYTIYDIKVSKRQHRPMRANTKVVLLATAVILFGGMMAIKLFQYLDGGAIGYVDAFFMSASSRTAGFNSIPMAELSGNSIMTIIILMLIGGAPGSTAGGMKITTVSLVAAAIYNTFTGNQKVLLFKREIPISNVLKAFTIVITFILMVAFGAIIFDSLQFNTPDGMTIMDGIFEVTSALCTVGLSLGATANLVLSSKMFLILYMFIGRVGLLTFLLFLLSKEKNSQLTYPEDRIIIG